MTHRKFMVVSTVIVASAIGFSVVRHHWIRNEWFDIQAQQLAAIKQLESHPPPGWDQRAWNNALVTPYNVWGNVTYHPNYSGISNAEMRNLKQDLDHIVGNTNRENSMQSVDRVFALLLRCGRKTEFISGFRDEFSMYSYAVNHATQGREGF